MYVDLDFSGSARALLNYSKKKLGSTKWGYSRKSEVNALIRICKPHITNIHMY